MTATVGAQPGTLGVPALQGLFTVVLPQLLGGDTISLQSVGTSQWGVYLGAAPVVTFDTFVSIELRKDWVISDYPVEQGGFESYNKVYIPFDARVKFASGGSEANRAALLASVDAAAPTLQLYNVVTPEKTYQSVNIKHYAYQRTATNGVGMITVEMWLEEVRVTISEGSVSTSGTATGAGTDTGVTPDTSGAAPEPSVDPVAPSGASPVDDGQISPTSGPAIVMPTPEVSTLEGAVINSQSIVDLPGL